MSICRLEGVKHVKRNMMKILAMDTALGACSAAIAIDDVIRAQAYEERARGHAEHLAPMVAKIFEQAEIHPQDITHIGVTTGPGTFTGQRVGLAFARAFGVAVNVPVFGITTLEALALGAQKLLTLSEKDMSLRAFDMIVSAIDARREEIYLQCFNTDLTPHSEPQVVTLANAPAHVSGKHVLLVGTGAHLLESHLSDRQVTLSSCVQPDACDFVMRIAALPVPKSPPSAFYLRPPDARLPTKAEIRA